MLLPREHETAFNKAPLIRAVSALLMVITILSAITRLVTRLLTVRNLKIDDTLVAASTLVVIAQSIAVIVQGANGMGKLEGIKTDQVDTILKARYVSDVLFIVALTLAKISATRTILGMAPRKKKKLIYGTEAFIGLWAITSIGGLFFQCSLPSPWDIVSGRCFNQVAFWGYIDALNIVSDLAITAILIEMFINLKTSTAKKTLVIGVFGCRIFIIPPIICHIYYFWQAYGTANPLFSLWRPTVITQVVQCLSVMSTCIPYLKPFLDSLESGQMAAGDILGGTRSKGSSGQSKSGGNYGSGYASRRNIGSRGNTTRGITSVATMASNASHRLQKYEMIDLDKSRNREHTTTVTGGATTSGGTTRSWDGESHTSQTVLVQQTWQVDIETKNDPTGST